MSNVYNVQGNLVNNPGPGCGRYTDENSLTVDWFATNPRPVEKATTEFQVAEVPATLPPNSGEILKVVAPEIEPTPAPVDAVSAGVTTSSFPQATVTA